jgi:hypothetical protein
MSVELLKEQFLSKFDSGDDSFYKHLLANAVQRLVWMSYGDYKGMPPDMEYLHYYEQFLLLYRREGDERFLKISSIFRKAAHKVHRVMVKKNFATFNNKFLSLV